MSVTSVRHAMSTFDHASELVLSNGREILLGLQQSTGMPWWLTIVSSTLVLRSVITLPLAVYQQRKLAQLEIMAPHMRNIAENTASVIAKANKGKGVQLHEVNKMVRSQVSNVKCCCSVVVDCL